MVNRSQPAITDMMRVAVISPDEGVLMDVERVLGDIASVRVVRKLMDYPDERDLQTFFQTYAPSVVLVDTRWLTEAVRLAGQIASNVRGTQVVAISRECNADLLLTALRAGMREFLPVPLDRRETELALGRLAEALRLNPQEIESSQQVFSFLPAKPGCGASTIALNTGMALANDSKNRVALMDFDLNCGILDFMLRLPAGYGLLDAAEHYLHMDASIWGRMVSKVGNLQFLRGGGPGSPKTLTAGQAQELLSHAKRNYDVVCLDHSGNLESHSLELLRQSNQIFLICTPEVTSLHAAKRSMERLQEMELADRVRIVVNRSHAGSAVSPQQVEEILGRGIFAAIPNDYAAVQTPMAEGSAVNVASPLGRRFRELAGRMLGRDVKATAGKKTLFSRWKVFSSERTAQQHAAV